MARKKIFSVGFKFPGNVAENYQFQSDQSLLDADIIVFEPSIYSYWNQKYTNEYLGKPSLYESNSFKLVEDSSHWRSELQIAFDNGKTIFVFLSKYEEVYVCTGQKEYSGTGRNRKVTNLVKKTNNYESLPLNFENIVPKKGKEIKVVKDLKYLAEYWTEFKKYSSYEVYLDGEIPNPILTTKIGNKVVGAIYTNGKGTMILIPPIRYDEGSFIDYDEKQDVNYWTKEAIVFGKKIASCLVEIDNALSTMYEGTPPPDWTRQDAFRIESETLIEKKIKTVTEKIQNLHDKRSELFIKLKKETGLRRLLYEKGHQLEEAILEALRLLGFKAEKYRDSDSEFDVVFLSPEGRFIGEAEGKDNKPISIEKLSQLERNIQEDFAKEGNNEYAKGVLFGNAFRLQKPSERGDFFTMKCISGAIRSKVALVRTPDLFDIVTYLKEQKDTSYKKKCRQILSQTEGEIVTFPSPSKKASVKSKKITKHSKRN